MYNLPDFKEPDSGEIKAFMQAHPLALLFGVDDQRRPVATQVPVLLEEREGKTFLIGHMSKGTDHIKAFQAFPENILAVFTSPNCYVSATWYTMPHMGSTWNYMSVHAHGPIRFGTEEELIGVMKKLTLYFEKNNPQSTTVYDNLPPEYLDKMMKGIRPFEIEVKRLEHVFKLSQNRDETSFQQIIDQLSNGDTGARFIAGEMQKRKPSLYPPKVL